MESNHPSIFNDNPGDLNFICTCLLLHKVLSDMMRSLTYDTFSLICGVVDYPEQFCPLMFHGHLKCFMPLNLRQGHVLIPITVF